MAEDIEEPQVSEDPFAKYGGKAIEKSEDPFAKYGGKSIGTQSKTEQVGGLTAYSDSRQKTTPTEEIKRPAKLTDYTSVPLEMVSKAKATEVSRKPSTQPVRKIATEEKAAAEGTRTNLQLPTTLKGGQFGIVAEPQQEGELQQKLQQREEDKQTAIKNSLLSQGIKPNTQQYLQKEKDLNNQLFNDDLVVDKDNTGEPKLFRSQGFGETLAKTIYNSFKAPIDAYDVNKINDPNQFVQKMNEQTEEESSKPSKILGGGAELIGGVVKPISLLALNAVAGGMGTTAMVSEAYYSALANEKRRLYIAGKQQGLSDVDAAKKAMDAATYTALPDAAMAFVMSGELENLPKTVPAVADNTFKNALIKSGKSVLKVSALGGASEVGKIGTELLGGYKETLPNAIGRVWGSTTEWGKMDLGFKIIGGIVPAAGYLKAAAKNWLKNVPEELIQLKSEQYGDAGEKIKQSIEDYKNAASNVEGYVPDEHLASFAGKIEKANKLQDDITQKQLDKIGKPEFVQNKIDEEISDIQNQIDGINKEVNTAAKKGIEPKEIDDATGIEAGIEPKINVEPIKTETELEKQAPEVQQTTETQKPTVEAITEVKPTAEKTETKTIEEVTPVIEEVKPIEVKSNKDVSKVFDMLLKDKDGAEDYGIHGLLADLYGGAEYNEDNGKITLNETRSGTGKMSITKKEFINDILSGKAEKEIPDAKEYINKVKQSIHDELGIKPKITKEEVKPNKVVSEVEVKPTKEVYDRNDTPIKIDDIGEGFVLHRGGQGVLDKGFHSIDKIGAEGYAGDEGKLTSSTIKKDAKILKLVSGDSENYSDNAKDIDEFYRIIGEKERKKSSEWATGENPSDITTRLWDNKSAQEKLKKAGIDIVIGNTIDGVDAFVVNENALEKQIPAEEKGSEDAEVKKQIENFGVNKKDVEPVHNVVSQIFNGLKKSGLTAAKTLGDWVSIGKGEEKPYSLKIDGKDTKVKNVQPEVVNGFYSPLEKIVTDSKFDKLPAKQWIEKYANSEEAKWTGLKNWLSKQEGSVSKSDIQQYLKDNRISIVEVVKKQNIKISTKKYQVLDSEGYDSRGESIEIEGNPNGQIETDNGDIINDFEIDGNDFVSKSTGYRLSLYDDGYKESGDTKFSQWQLEGEKENYKEVLVTIPSKTEKVQKLTPNDIKLKSTKGSRDAWRNVQVIFPDGGEKMLWDTHLSDSEIKENEIEREYINNKFVAKRDADFKSSHFDEPNILVHLRMNTRIDSKGNKVLFLEEVQSDYGQKGKREGFNPSFEIKKENGKFNIYSSVNAMKEPAFSFENIKEAESMLSTLKSANKNKVPSAPFVTDTNAWTKLGLKVALKEAVAQGADKIAWTTGEQQNDRYDLSKSYRKLSIKPQTETDKYGRTEENGTYLIEGIPNKGDMSGGAVMAEIADNIPLDKIEDYVGKEIAEKVKQGQEEFEGNDLKVGGKGMKGFYGSPTEGSLGIVGNVAKSLFKQEPKTVEIKTLKPIPPNTSVADIYEAGGMEEFKKKNGTSSTQHSIDITPELKASVEGGQPLFLAYGAFEKVGFEETPEYKKLKESGHIKEGFDIKSISGKPTVVINPDNMITGKILSKEGKPILDANGGIHFVSKFGDVWASSDKSTANTLAKYINTARELDIKNGGDGVIHIIVTKGTLGKSLTSHTGAKGAMGVIEHLVDKGMIPLRDFRNALISAGKGQGIDFNGKLDSKSIHEDISKKFFGVNDSSFKGRGFFVRDVINHIAENSKEVHNNINDIRDALNSKEVGRKITFGEAGIRDAIGNLFADQMTQGVPNSHAYATIEISKPVKVIEGEHESYPFHIKQIDDERPRLNILSETKHIKDIVNPKEGSTNLGSNQVGMAEGTVKSSKDIESLKQSNNAQYRIESGKNIVEALKDFDGSPKAVVAITHEVMHPTIVAIIDGAKESNEVGTKHTQTIVDEFNKANPKSQVSVEDLINGNDAFKNGTTNKQYRAVQEFIAKAWEKYHTEGAKGFSEPFQKVLDQITQAFKAVYKSITGKELTPELKKMFDDILGKQEEHKLQSKYDSIKSDKAKKNFITKNFGEIPDEQLSDIVKNNTDLRTIKDKIDAIQKSGAGEVLQPTPQGDGSKGGKRGGMEQGEQGAEATTKKNGEENGDGQRVGISHKSLTELADKLGLEQPERGDVLTPEEYSERGKLLIKNGADPIKAAEEFKKDNKVNSDIISVARAHFNELVRDVNDARIKFGIDSEEYKKSLKEAKDWAKNVVKPMGTAFGEIGRSLQGQVDLDTGNFVSVSMAVQEKTGKDLSTEQTKEVERLTTNVSDLNKKIQDLEKKLTDTISKGEEAKPKAKEGIKEKSKEIANVIRKGKLSKPDIFSSASPASLVWDAAIEITAKTVEVSGDIAQAIADGLEHIKNSDWYKNSDSDKQKAAQKAFRDFVQNQDIKIRFAEKKDNKFTTEEAKSIWEYAKEEYLDKGSDYREMLNGVSKDLGLNRDQVRTAISQPKGAKEITDEMYRNINKRNSAINEAKQWVEEQGNSKTKNFLKAVPSAFFKLKTFGHGTVGGITHAGTNIFQISKWKSYFPFFAKQFKYAFGDTAKYEMAMEDLKNDPQFTFWQRAGLAVDPKVKYDDYQGNFVDSDKKVNGIKKLFNRLGVTGDRGFNALKVYRLDLAKGFYDRLSNEEKADPNTAKEIAKLVNHSTGTSELDLGRGGVSKFVSTAFFAPKLEASRWQGLIGDPVKAAKTFTNWKESSPAEKAGAKLVARNAGEKIATYVALLAANSALLSLMGSKQKINYTNPLSSDWLKFKTGGGKTLDITGGTLASMKLLGTLIDNTVIGVTGTKKELWKKPAEKDYQAIGTQLRYKLSPFASTIADLVETTDAMGRPLPYSNIKPKKGETKYTYLSYVGQQQTPIPISAGIREAIGSMKERGMTNIQIQDVLMGTLYFTVEGFTGAKLGNEPKKKK